MTRLPTLNAWKVVSALKRAGFVEDGQRGSHLYLRHPTDERGTCVPMHAGRDIKRSLLRLILNQAGISEGEFRRLL